jgi:hypothetical protein
MGLAASLLSVKTTIEINDELLRQAKIRAAERGMTLRELVERGLERLLAESEPSPGGYVLRDASVGDPNAPAPELDWDEIRDEATRWRMWGE